MLLKNCPEDVCTYIKKNKETYVPVGPELVQTSTFCYDDYQNFMDQSKDENNNYIYTRGANPTTSYLEDMLSDLIGCQKCKVFSSGMGAIAATLPVSYTHLTLPTKLEWCRSRWSPYH